MMLSKNEQVNQELNTGERLIYTTSEKLIPSSARPVGHSMVGILRFLRRNHPVESGNIPEKPGRPTGPFAIDRSRPRCSLMIFVPRNFKSRFIDHVTGRYGYSHVAIDCGEIDVPTGKKVMIESTVFDVVHRSFQDTYGLRPFISIPLEPIGMDCDSFCECVKSNLGEKYDYAEVLTWDEIDNPARQVCSDLAAVCMPDWLLEKIAQARKKGQLPHDSISAVHHRDGRLEMFISPNAFAKFFNAPRGEKIHGPGYISEPDLIPSSNIHPTWIQGIPATAITILALLSLAAWYYLSHARRRELPKDSRPEKAFGDK